MILNKMLIVKHVFSGFRDSNHHSLKVHKTIWQFWSYTHLEVIVKVNMSLE